MITIEDTGLYELTETKRGVKLLYLHGQPYAWITARGIGQLLVWSAVPHVRLDKLSSGAFRIYRVEEEPQLSDQLHIELEFGADMWQGYVLPTGLPTPAHSRVRIIATKEVITHNRQFRSVDRLRSTQQIT